MAGLLTTAACSPAVLAAPAHAAPAGRAWEMVSPPAKFNGGVVFGQRISDDGDAVGFVMNNATGEEDGAYAVAPYLSRRTPAGWVTRSAAPPMRSEHRGSSEVNAQLADFSDDFREVYLRTNDPLDVADGEPLASGTINNGWDVYRFGVESRQHDWISRPVPAQADEYRSGAAQDETQYLGHSRDGSHVFFLSGRRLLPDVPAGNLTRIYEAVDGQVRMVGIGPDERPLEGTTTTLAQQYLPTQSDEGSQAISEDGSRVFWQPAGSSQNPGSYPLYLREDGVRTLAVSRSRRAATIGHELPAEFLGAARDGSVVYFVSPELLTDDATAGGLYRWERAGEQLTFLAATGNALEGDGATPTINLLRFAAAASASGERLYFASTEALLTGAQTGDRNIYLWDGQLRFVASVSRDSMLRNDPRMRITADGRFLAFTTDISLDPRHASGRNALYRYDAQSGETACVSCRPDGEVGTGDSGLRPWDVRYALLTAPTIVNPRNLTADGRVYFQSTEGLVAHDTNGAADVYEWDGGNVTLLSSGRGTGSQMVDNSSDGSTVAFMTEDALVGWDTDGGYPDVYVARVGGGFPEPPTRTPPCQGDSCQGPFAPVPLPPLPASEQIDPIADEADEAPPTFRPLRPTARQLRSYARSGSIALRVRVSGAGIVAVRADGRIGRRSRKLGEGWSRATGRGTVRVDVPLSRVATRQLATGRALPLRLTVRHSGAEKERQLTLRLRRPDERRARTRVGARKGSR